MMHSPVTKRADYLQLGFRGDVTCGIHLLLLIDELDRTASASSMLLGVEDTVERIQFIIDDLSVFIANLYVVEAE